MVRIFESEHFIVEAHDRPHIDRLEGGHIVISPKVAVEDRTKLSSELAKELMKLTMVTGDAMMIGLQRRGIDIGRINYQDMGNWRPTLHVHVYGRAKSAQKQKFGEALLLPKRETGFYDGMQPLDGGDIAEIQKEMNRLIVMEKYQNF